MEKIDGLLELLIILIKSTVHITVKINKDALSDIRTYLQNVQDKIVFWRLNHNYRKMSYNRKDTILNLCLFRIIPFLSFNMTPWVAKN